jgi:thioredoxin reductase (NADPH)
MRQADVIVIGAGPAGLAAALYAGRALLKTVIYERTIVGGQIVEAYDVDNYPGFQEGINGGELAERMLQHAARFGAEVIRQEVTGLELDGTMKRTIAGEDGCTAPIVVVASGATHRKLEVPGEKELAGKGVSYCATCDGPFFRDKRIVVVGGGDAAMTEGVFLTRFAAEIKLVHRRQGFRARPVNVEAAKGNEKIEFVLDTVVTEVLGEERVTGVAVRNTVSEETSRIDCEGVFVLIGHDPNTGFLSSVLPDHAGGVVPVDGNMETSVPGLYAVGDVRAGSYRQVGTAVGEGITAAMHAEGRIEELRAS